MRRKSTTAYSRRRQQRKILQKLASTHPIAVIAGVAILLIVAWRLNAHEQQSQKPLTTGSEELMRVGVPQGVKQQMVDYTGFTVSFNADAHQPNYVAWELTADKLDGQAQRESKFNTDEAVDGCATIADYRRSGFDRGHMMPAADAKWSADAMTESHLLTNICPQDHKLNGGAWATLEGNCRKWAARDSAIIIICGPVLCDRMPRSIGSDNRVPVPERFFKVVLAPYSIPLRGIGFIMNNGQVDGGVQTSAVSIDQVEAITGFDFFASLPDEIENDVESQCAYHEWQRSKR